MSSRMRKKRNQRAENVKSGIRSILATRELTITGCSYDVHEWIFKQVGDIWYKECVAVNNDRVCGAIYQMTQMEIDWMNLNAQHTD